MTSGLQQGRKIVFLYLELGQIFMLSTTHPILPPPPPPPPTMLTLVLAHICKEGIETNLLRLFRHFLCVLVGNIFYAHILQGFQDWKIVDQDSRREDDVVEPLPLLVFHILEEFEIWNVVCCLASKRTPDTRFSTIWWFTQWKSRFCDSIDMLFRCNWKFKLSNEITKPGWTAFLTLHSSCLAWAMSWWQVEVHFTWAACADTRCSSFSCTVWTCFISPVILSTVFTSWISCLSPSLSRVDRTCRFVVVTLSLLDLPKVACFARKGHC